MKKKYKTCDGNTAATNIAYAFSEVAAIFPITPSSPMGEMADAWSVTKKNNIFGQVVKVQEMQSEGGAAGAIHGSLTAGALTTTFTASQGILLMLPNMYKIAGEMLPTVFHVASRSLAYQALSIYADHSDVMSTRATGFALLSSSSVQEAQDMAVIAHMATLKSSIPFMHFFDGFRTSHEIQKIELIPEETLKEFVDKDAIARFKARGIKPENPYAKVGAENPDVYFQGRETVNKYYDATPGVVKACMDLFAEKTGRRYDLFNYIGHPEAEKIIIAMGSSTQTAEEAVNYLVNKGEKVGILRVHLYRPFSVEDFIRFIPESVQKIAVLDRTKESGSVGEPVYLDVLTALSQKGKGHIKIIGGRYGLSSKEFTPTMVKSVFNHLDGKCTHNFTVGINDDVTFLSIPMNEHIDTVSDDVTQCKFWGYGSDGTVSANKNSIKIIGEKTDKQVQAYFAYDSKKSGGVTISHLRFGDKPIKSTYEVHEADFIALHKPSYIGQYDVLEGIKENGNFLINTHLPKEEIFASFTKDMQEIIKNKHVKVWAINAFKIAREAGLRNKISTIMQTAFFKVANIIPFDQALDLIKEHVSEQFKSKGQEIIDDNFKAIDATVSQIEEVPIMENVSFVPEIEKFENNNDKFVQEVIKPIARKHGDNIPVSAMTLDGAIPIATTKLEKRGVAVEVPEWVPEECIQCGLCSFSCPHAAIRTKQIRQSDLVHAPKQFATLESNAKNDEQLHFKVQVYTEDCVGCNV
ncbi:pyruvate:ferredoxin (flavodoxin) oxidoreductase, partial [Candidatus Woesearchaeota archaeon]|nr:pyruvate:ferredoxin (flavodoxin) oxidoreductase [Candidatus Woesearchaeota archaeon]